MTKLHELICSVADLLAQLGELAPEYGNFELLFPAPHFGDKLLMLQRADAVCRCSCHTSTTRCC